MKRKNQKQNSLLAIFLALLITFTLAPRPLFAAVGDPVLETADPLLHVGDQNAGTDITADLEEEGQINATNVTGDAADDQVLLGTGASALAYSTIPNCVAGNVLTYTQATNTFGCEVDGGGTNPVAITPPEALVISTGSITLAGGANTITYHTVDTEGAAGTDDLTAINCTAGSQHVISALSDTQTVVAKAALGLISDFSMDNTLDRLVLHCLATNTVTELSRSNNAL